MQWSKNEAIFTAESWDEKEFSYFSPRENPQRHFLISFRKAFAERTFFDYRQTQKSLIEILIF